MDSFLWIPQRRYNAQTPYISEGSILLSAQRRVGVNLGDALDGHLELLDNPDVRPMTSLGKARITLRILVSYSLAVIDQSIG